MIIKTQNILNIVALSAYYLVELFELNIFQLSARANWRPTKKSGIRTLLRNYLYIAGLYSPNHLHSLLFESFDWQITLRFTCLRKRYNKLGPNWKLFTTGIWLDLNLLSFADTKLLNYAVWIYPVKVLSPFGRFRKLYYLLWILNF